MLEFQGKVEGGRVVPQFPQDAEDLGDWEGATVRCVLTQARTRSPSQLRLWWGFCGKVAENWPGADSIDSKAVSDLLKLEMGHAYVFRDAAGGYRRLPKSIAFNALSQDQFNGVMNKALACAHRLFGQELTDACFREVGLLDYVTGHHVT